SPDGCAVKGAPRAGTWSKPEERQGTARMTRALGGVPPHPIGAERCPAGGGGSGPAVSRNRYYGNDAELSWIRNVEDDAARCKRFAAGFPGISTGGQVPVS